MDERTLVVLGAAVWPGGVASPTLKRRTEWAARLFKQGGYDAIVASGGLGKNPPSEADVMAMILREADIPEGAIILDRAALVTLDTAAFAARMPDAKERRFVAVTDVYHGPRTRLAFRAFKLRVEISSPPLGRSTSRARLARSFVREAPALLLYGLHFLRLRFGGTTIGNS